ncbi:threonine/serine exporter family protein [Yinghuangia sp. ASG 101]|uniref:threonine/serine ThrE exporter family protein n=1 Tax=Yinghuangia sp. ASG 101 TaxID=2896848 RepID=UPI001E517C77|nr:threonine/serine exporter family protein [Yinghuangia sp. ASG 101]UGQ13087.1 threonine/serine exporter family protein [Yinghuangia sp. ASG 101]
MFERPRRPGTVGGPRESRDPDRAPATLPSTEAAAPVPRRRGRPTARLPWQPPPLASLPWQERLRARLRADAYGTETPERTDTGVSVPHVLDLALRTGELLLASGEGGEDVEAAMLGITDAYGLHRCTPNATFTAMTLSYQPSLADTPVTAERVVRRRATDFTRLAAAHRLVEDITTGEVTLEDAYHRLVEIRRNRHPYPRWLVLGATGSVAATASVLVGGGVIVACAAFFAAVIGDWLAQVLARRGVPEFYQFVLAAMPAAAVAVGLIKADIGVLPYAVVTGGLFALLPGRALVAAVQDGLTGFYITAAARLLEVFYLIVGIICGIAIVLYAGNQLGVELNVEGSFFPASNPPVQLAAAAGLSLAFAVLVQVRPDVLAIAAAGGAASWSIFEVLRIAGAAPILATAVATGVVGLLGQLLARAGRTSALPYVIPAIGPLLPGGAMYQGLLGLALGHTDKGWLGLVNAAGLALALAVGVNLGSEVARFVLPVPQRGGREMRAAAKRTRGF